MALSKSITDREYKKFVETGGGETAIRTVVESGSIDASFSPGGLNLGFLVTTVSIGSTATKLPTNNLTNRNSISIQNKGDFVLYIGPTDQVTADTVIGNTSGLEVPGGGFFNVDVTDNIDIYGICESGQSVILKITEFA